MKKILIVSDSMESHGAAKSLATLLNFLDYDSFIVDVYLFNPSIKFFEISPKAHILPTDQGLEAYFWPAKQSLKELVRCHKWRLLFFRIYNYLAFWKGTKTQRLQFSWDKLLNCFESLPSKYDLAISYQDNFTSTFVLKKVCARRVAVWNHNLVQDLGVNLNKYRADLEGFNTIVTVSQNAKESFINHIGKEFASRIIVFNNLQDIENIIHCSQIRPSNKEFMEDHRVKIVSIGRLTKQKGFDFAVEVAKILVERGCVFSWYIIGNGDDKKAIEKMISDYKLKNYIFLLGLQSNPYPYVLNCDIYAQPSRWESEGIAVKEAIILRKCVVGTPTTMNGLEDGKDILIVPLEKEKWATMLESLIRTPKKIAQFTENMPQYNASNERTRCNALINNLIQ